MDRGTGCAEEELSEEELDNVARAVVQAALLCRYDGNDSIASDSLRERLVMAVKRDPMVTGRLFGEHEVCALSVAK